jgi:cold-inducible RNA-binding protein
MWVAGQYHENGVGVYPEDYSMSKRLYVGNLKFSVSDDSLREVFAQFGNVDFARVITERGSGRSKGFGFVEMATEQEAAEAVERLNGSSLEGREMIVSIARPMASNS